jgi:hypothetical protein
MLVVRLVALNKTPCKILPERLGHLTVEAASRLARSALTPGTILSFLVASAEVGVLTIA